MNFCEATGFCLLTIINCLFLKQSGCEDNNLVVGIGRFLGGQIVRDASTLCQKDDLIPDIFTKNISKRRGLRLL